MRFRLLVEKYYFITKKQNEDNGDEQQEMDNSIALEDRPQTRKSGDKQES